MFDFTQDQASSGKPKGEFNLRICEAKIKKSQAGNDYISLKLAITGKKFAKFPIFENFVLSNEIARGRFSDLLDKAGVDRKFEDLSVLLNKMVGAKVIHDKDGNCKISAFKEATEEDSGEEF